VRFRDRADAGQQLAAHLVDLRAEHPVVLGLPRGGMPVAAEIATMLDAPLDVLVVRKLGLPGQPELGIGALGEGGVRVINHDLVLQLDVSSDAVDEVAAREGAELARRVARYRGDRAPAPVVGRTVVLVDDGLATGFTARAAIEVLRHAGAQRVVLAVPVAPGDTLESLRTVADAVVCLHTPSRFHAIGEWYDDFRQLDDAEVAALLV
jgi:putative phosphoribosyl transferase